MNKKSSLLPALPLHGFATWRVHRRATTFTMLLYQKFILLCLVLLVVSNSTAYSQRPLGSWNILNTKLNFDDHWSVWAEGQLRSLQFYDEFTYYEVKGGVTYSLKQNVAFTIGIGHYETFTAGGNFEQPVVTEETRTWFQMVLEQKLDWINFEHRYRVEQRHISTGYKNRFRYRLNVVVPVNNKEVIPKTLFAYIGDEVFFTNKTPFYERNRFFTGLGYKFSPVFSVQSGYMRQFNYSPTPSSSHDYLQVALYINFNSKNFKRQSIPSPAD